MPSRILVTGGAGFIGSAVVRHAVGHCEHTVLVVDKLTYAGDLESLAPVAHKPGYSFVRADIVDAAKIRELVGSFRSLNRRSGRIHRDQHRRHVCAAAGSPRLLAATPAEPEICLSLPPYFDR
jgi:nucleoside-diphosphate-sugar epimerase